MKTYGTLDAFLESWSDKLMLPVERLREIGEKAQSAHDVAKEIKDLPFRTAVSFIGNFRRLAGMPRLARSAQSNGQKEVPTGLRRVAPALAHLDRLVQKQRSLEIELEQVKAEIAKHKTVAALAENLKREIEKLETNQ